MPFGGYGPNDARESMTCEGITVWGANPGSTLEITLDPDCLGVSMKVKMNGTGYKGYAGEGKLCTITGTYQARVKQ